MPRGRYTRRTRRPAATDAPAPATETPKSEAATEAASVVSAPRECSMIETKWSGLPCWKCRECRVDTLVSEDAAAARKACRKL